MAPGERRYRFELLCDLTVPRAHAELWRLAENWHVRPVRVLTGWLWEAA